MSPKRERDQRWIDAITPEILAAVEERATDGALTCAVARKLAEEINAPYQVVGAAADSAGIRVKSCELGCF